MNLSEEGIIEACINPPHRYPKPVKGFTMSLLSKILDKLGLRKEKDEPATGTTGSTSSESHKPASTIPSAKPSTAGKPAGSAPTSEKGVGTTARVADRRQRDDVAVKHAPAP